MAAVNIRNLRIVASLIATRRHLETGFGRSRKSGREAAGAQLERHELIGSSTTLSDVIEQAELVAPADTTVLLIGETGTGKELVAHAIHTRSRRRARPFVAVNCAALPESLVESELFGYEKGAFTGALTRKPGKFEVADSGTLLLDEIGDLPAQAQAKLLRVLQEREVQRVGGTRAEPVDVRLIAATNQDLDAAIAAGRFRSDLFYRLSVFPIRLPPLRERKEDIPPLATFFVAELSQRLGRPPLRIETEAFEQLTAYDWPGNVRELQNVMERAVILARDGAIGCDVIRIFGPAAAAPASGGAAPPRHDPSESSTGRGRVIRFSDAERVAILRAVELAGWRISGRGGAADILGLKPTTLHAKMRKLGIRRPTAEIETEEQLRSPQAG
jgi:transcriptional regulator with GAF, ATPase, and Fis domain